MAYGMLPVSWLPPWELPWLQPPRERRTADATTPPVYISLHYVVLTAYACAGAKRAPVQADIVSPAPRDIRYLNRNLGTGS